MLARLQPISERRPRRGCEGLDENQQHGDGIYRRLLHCGILEERPYLVSGGEKELWRGRLGVGGIVFGVGSLGRGLEGCLSLGREAGWRIGVRRTDLV